jgi:hypothetical protein
MNKAGERGPFRDRPFRDEITPKSNARGCENDITHISIAPGLELLNCGRAFARAH